MLVVDYHPNQGGRKILLVALCYRDQEKLWPDAPEGLNTDLAERNFTPFLLNHYKDFIPLFPLSSTASGSIPFSNKTLVMDALLFAAAMCSAV